jgi:hypothetical protein
LALASYAVWVAEYVSGANENTLFSGESSARVTPAATDSTTTIPSLTQGKTYAIKMYAVNALGAGEVSAVVYLVCGDKPATPNAPTPENMSQDSITKTSITLAWNVPSSNGGSAVTGYRIYINDLSVGDWALAYEGEGYPTRQVYTVKGLEAGQEYRFKVAAENRVGSSANSSELLVTASNYPAAPSQPQLVSGTSTSS